MIPWGEGWVRKCVGRDDTLCHQELGHPRNHYAKYCWTDLLDGSKFLRCRQQGRGGTSLFFVFIFVFLDFLILCTTKAVTSWCSWRRPVVFSFHQRVKHQIKRDKECYCNSRFLGGYTKPCGHCWKYSGKKKRIYINWTINFLLRVFVLKAPQILCLSHNLLTTSVKHIAYHKFVGDSTLSFNWFLNIFYWEKNSLEES